MTSAAAVGVNAARVGLVSDSGYYDTVNALIDRATGTCLASVFIVDLNAHDDPDTKVLKVLHGMQNASWRGVDVRLLIGGSTQNLAIDEACHIAHAMATGLDIDCRILAQEGRTGSHMKFVAVDDHLLSGSHNWSLGAFSSQIQDSLLISSAPIASYMRGVFESQWLRAG